MFQLISAKIDQAGIQQKLETMSREDQVITEDHDNIVVSVCSTLRTIQDMACQLDGVQQRLTNLILDAYALKTDFLLLRDPSLEDRVLETLSQLGC